MSIPWDFLSDLFLLLIYLLAFTGVCVLACILEKIVHKVTGWRAWR